MNQYQMLFIIDSSVQDEAKEALIQKFSDLITGLNGSINTVEKIGLRKLAYEINHKSEGYYVLIEFAADATVPAEVDRQMRINDGIMRHLIVSKNA